MFKPTLPSAEDWARDPAQSWGRLEQALNYALDVYNTTRAQIPVLQQRIATFRTQLQRLPADVSRTALLDQLTRHEQAVTALQVQQSSVQAQALNAITQARQFAAQIGQALHSVGIGAVPVAAAVAVIAVVGLVLTAALQFGSSYQARKLESETLGARILEYANTHNLTPAQLATVSEAVSKAPRPKDASGFGLLDSLGGILPILVGVLAAVYLGPPLLKRLGVQLGGRS